MNRFFAEPKCFSGDKVEIQGSEAVHIHTVLRLKTGDPILVMDGKGSCFKVKLLEVGKNRILGEVLGKESIDTESPVKINVGFPLIKGNKNDHFIRMATELGVHALYPIEFDRSVVKPGKTPSSEKISRWQRIMQEACKQCGRRRVPLISPNIVSLETFCENFCEDDIKLAIWEKETRQKIKDLDTADVATIVFFTGPEGGITDEEIDKARRFGFQTVSLGPRRLRAETAPIAVLSILQNLWGDL